MRGVLARGQREGTVRRDIDALEIHKAIAALGMFNVTNQYTFAPIFQCDMGRSGDVASRRAAVTEMILRYVCRKNAPRRRQRRSAACPTRGLGAHRAKRPIA